MATGPTLPGSGNAGRSTGNNLDQNQTTAVNATGKQNDSAPRSNLDNGSLKSVLRDKIGNLKTPPRATPGLDNGASGVPALKPTAKLVGLVNNTLNDNKLRNEKNQAHVKIAVTVNQLEIYQKRIARSRLSAEDKALISAEIAENIAWYREQDSLIQAATDTDSVAEIMAGVNAYSDDLKSSLKKDAGLLASDNLGRKIEAAENVSTLVAARISTLEVNGTDTTGLRQKLADYDGHVAAADQHALAARANFNAITAEANAERNFAEGNRQINLAEVQLGLAYNDLKEIYRSLLRAKQ